MIAKNNPLNIRYNKNTKWLGQTGQCKGFVEFDTLDHGYRAALWLIKRTYMSRYGLRTVRSIISRFAPPSENNTERYIHDISLHMCVKPDSVIGFYHVTFLVASMAMIETSSYVSPYFLRNLIVKYNI